MSYDKVKLFMHMGGNFISDPLRYVGGQVIEWEVDTDYICFHTFVSKVVEENFVDVAEFSYVEPGMEMNEGLRVCYDNNSFINMINHATNLNSLDVYVVHPVSQAVEVHLLSVEGDNVGFDDPIKGLAMVGEDNYCEAEVDDGPSCDVEDWQSDEGNEGTTDGPLKKVNAPTKVHRKIVKKGKSVKNGEKSKGNKDKGKRKKEKQSTKKGKSKSGEENCEGGSNSAKEKCGGSKSHAISCIKLMKKELVDHVAMRYKKSVYKELYTDFVVPAVPGPEFWKNCKLGPIHPPIEKAMPGRPKKKRHLEKGERLVSACGTRLIKRNYKITCKTCKLKGHNSSTCPSKNKPSSSNAAHVEPTEELPAAEPVEPTEEVPAEPAEPVQADHGLDDFPEDVYEMYKEDYSRTEFEQLLAEAQLERRTKAVENENVPTDGPNPSYTLYAPRPQKQQKKKKSGPTSSSQPLPPKYNSTPAASHVQMPNSQPISTTEEILQKLSRRSQQILDVANVETENLTKEMEPSQAKKKGKAKVDVQNKKQKK